MNKEEKTSPKCPICGKPTHKKSKYCIFHASAEEKTEDDFIRELKKRIKEIKEKNEDYNFKKYIFVGDIDFKVDLGITVFKKVNFDLATFKGIADFKEATLKGPTDFGRAIFEGPTNFGGAIFEDAVTFGGTTFVVYPNFRGATFKGHPCFSGTIFEVFADFKEATFEVFADFKEAKFKGPSDFTRATFRGVAGFTRTTFKGDPDFRGAIFEDFVNFREATFKGIAEFKEVTFESNVSFVEAIFEKDSSFELKYLIKGINLSGIRVFPGKKWSIIVDNGKGIISFERAYLENAYLEIELIESVLIDFAGALLKNTKIKKEQIENHISQEKENKYSETQEIYLLLKNNFHSIGRYEDESWAFGKEKEMERQSYSFEAFTENGETEAKKTKGKTKKEKRSKINLYFSWLKDNKFRKWLWSCFCNAIYGYGEKPKNVAISAMIIILLFSAFFYFLGINSPEIIEIKSPTVQEIFNSDSEIISKGGLINKATNNPIDCIYFSAITFTTLGYGDFRPLEGLGRILAGSEAFIGAFMMALFVYTFARRTGGR